MSAETRNEFLDADNSDDDIGRNSDSEDDFQKGGRSAKRRVDENEDSDASDHSDDERDDKDNNTNKNKNTNGKDEAETSSAKKGEEPASLDDPGPNSFPKQKKPSLPKLELNLAKPLHKKNLIVTEAAIKKSGVIYLSRVPPFMKPQKLRSLLEPYGQINRIFLAPEDPAEHARRVRAGGNKKRSYSEGWVEFVKKKDAKKVVDLLNAQTIGGKKSSWYRDDVWSLKYLSGFKWHHLTEQIAAENAERQSRMRAEISKSTKENKEFVKNVEKAKVLNGIEAKKAAKRKKADVDEGQGGGGAEAKEETVDREAKGPQKRRTFAQVPTVKKRKTEEQQPDQVQRVLSKIF